MARVFTVAAAAAAQFFSPFCNSGHVSQKVAFHKDRCDVFCSQWRCTKAFLLPELQTMQLRSQVVRASVDPVKLTSRDEVKESDSPPPGCSRLKVELSKPLGIILEEDKAGSIYVAEVIENGNAYNSGLIDVGDQLIATSAVVYGREEDYQGVKVRKGMQVVRLNVFGEKFDTVMAAIGTHPAHIKVTLEIQKCQRTGETNGAAAN